MVSPTRNSTIIFINPTLTQGINNDNFPSFDSTNNPYNLSFDDSVTETCLVPESFPSSVLHFDSSVVTPRLFCRLHSRAITSVDPSLDPNTERRNMQDASHIFSQDDLNVYPEFHSSNDSTINPSFFTDAKTEIVQTILPDVDSNVFKVSSSINLNLKVNVIIIFYDTNYESTVNPGSIPSFDGSDNPDMVPSLFTTSVSSNEPTHIQCLYFDPTDSPGSKPRHVSSLCSQSLLNKFGIFFAIMIVSLTLFISLFPFLSGMDIYCSDIPSFEFRNVNFIHAQFYPIYIIPGCVEILSYAINTVYYLCGI